MSEAGSVPMGDVVYLGNSQYVAVEGGEAGVVFAHECPDGTYRYHEASVHEEVQTAGERLADLRGRLDEIERDAAAASERFGRRFGNETRRHMAYVQLRDLRTERVQVQAEIDALTDAGVVAGITLGGDDGSR